MNLEKAIEFISEQSAKTEVHLAALSRNDAKIEANLAELGKNQAKIEANLAATSASLAQVAKNQVKTDKQVAATAALVKTGMKLVIRQGTAQQQTDRALTELIASLKQKPNGRQH